MINSVPLATQAQNRYIQNRAARRVKIRLKPETDGISESADEDLGNFV